VAHRRLTPKRPPPATSLRPGFSVDNDTIWDFFNHRGRRSPTFGYPGQPGLSVPRDSPSNFFQRQVVQLDQNGAPSATERAGSGIDALQPSSMVRQSLQLTLRKLAGAPPPSIRIQGRQPSLSSWRTPPDVFEGPSGEISIQTFKNTVPMSSAFPNGGDAGLLPGFDLELWGRPPPVRPAFDPNNHKLRLPAIPARDHDVLTAGCKMPPSRSWIGDYLKEHPDRPEHPEGPWKRKQKNSPAVQTSISPGRPTPVAPDSTALPGTVPSRAPFFGPKRHGRSAGLDPH